MSTVPPVDRTARSGPTNFVPNDPAIAKPPPWILWQRLHPLAVFRTFTDEQRDALLAAYEREPGLCVREFNDREIVCRKGAYELDLCFILSGGVNLVDELHDVGRTILVTLNAGDFYGELGALGGLPRSVDVVARGQTEIFYVPRYALKYIEINPEARAIIADRYRDLAVKATAIEIELFRGVPAVFVNQLAPKCEVLRYDLRGIPLVTQGDPGDALYIVRDGFVQVVREEPDGSHRVLAYLRTGEYFGEMALFETGVRWASVLTAGKCELIKIQRDDFYELCREYPQILEQVRRVIEQRREQERRITPEVSALLERSGQLGVIQADALLVMDLELCINCDQCVHACEALHGKSRLIRNGIQIGKYLIPSACRHCDDPKCMNSCPTGSIKRRPEGEIYFDYDMCIGCGNCAIACPYDNIAMIDTPAFDQAQARKARVMNDPNFFRPYPIAAHDTDSSWWKRLFGHSERGGPVTPPAVEEKHIPAAFPIKCDLCDGLPFMGCVHNCPTGAAIRIDPAKLFEQTGAVSAGSRVRKAHGGSD
jgi:CRP-like cAMP-binding protein/Fe-S-cluster-containing hydrogenase component 2